MCLILLTTMKNKKCEHLNPNLKLITNSAALRRSAIIYKALDGKCIISEENGKMKNGKMKA